MTVNNAYKFRLYPQKKQQVYFSKVFGMGISQRIYLENFQSLNKLRSEIKDGRTGLH